MPPGNCAASLLFPVDINADDKNEGAAAPSTIGSSDAEADTLGEFSLSFGSKDCSRESGQSSEGATGGSTGSLGDRKGLLSRPRLSKLNSSLNIEEPMGCIDEEEPGQLDP